jgi:FixJ family two-component response regulator
MESTTLVHIVDDDPSVRLALEMLLISAGLDVVVYESAENFIKSEIREENACLIVDFMMKGINGLELQEILTERGSKLPVIFLTAFDSEETRQKAKQAGAVGYFRKPVDDQALLDTIQWALSNSSSK